MKTPNIFNRVIDIWPGFYCGCHNNSSKGHSKICSLETVIIVEVDMLVKDIPKSFHSIPIEQRCQMMDDEHTRFQCTEGENSCP